MDNDNPFWTRYESKPEWLENVHVPRAKGVGTLAKEMVGRARSGSFVGVVIAGGNKGRGLTHFLDMELQPALEAEGAVAEMILDFPRTPTNDRFSQCLDMQDVAARLITRLGDVPEPGKRLSGPEKAAAELEAYRKRERIPVSPKPPYLPKILAQGMSERREFMQEELDMDDYIPHRLGMRRISERRKLGNYRALCGLAATVRKPLCLIGDLKHYWGCSEKHVYETLSSEFAFIAENYYAPGVIVVLGAGMVSENNVERACAHSVMEPAKLGSTNAEWLLRVLAAHQQASAKEWFTQEALEKIADAFAGRPAHAMYFCARLSGRAKKLPVELKAVEKELGNKRWSDDNKAFRMEF